MKNQQCANTLLVIRPHHFGFNKETASNNAFQRNSEKLTQEQIEMKALEEFDRFVDHLESAGINLLVIEDTENPIKTDAVFPNNWITTHSNGAIITYPMQSKNRRKERREDIIEKLMKDYHFDRRYSLEQYEAKQLYLEGTGSMILDRINKVVYACISVRTDPTILDKFCALTNYERVVFVAKDQQSQPIYHTNVMMCLGEQFVVICLDAIVSLEERNMVRSRLEITNKEIIEISQDQMSAYAGNMLQAKNKIHERLIIMSDQAFNSLTESQKNSLKSHGEIIHTSLDTIEFYGGGSARCMLAEIFTPIPGANF